jgi:hypothetical protein
MHTDQREQTWLLVQREQGEDEQGDRDIQYRESPWPEREKVLGTEVEKTAGKPRLNHGASSTNHRESLPRKQGQKLTVILCMRKRPGSLASAKGPEA